MAQQTLPNQSGIQSGRLSAEEYEDNFADLHPPLSTNEALVDSDRCYFCYDAPCQTACPTGIDIPMFIRQISTGQAENAAKTIFDENILGGMCARVCPTETLCEEACVRMASEGEPVKIGQLQRYATDHFLDDVPHPYDRATETGKRVAVVGAGPAGLACAHRLATHGHQVTIFDAKPKAGGLNEYGIAAYKSVDDFAQQEVDFVMAIGGIDIQHDQALGRNVHLDDLRNDFDAVFLGLGLGSVNASGCEGEDLDGVIDAVDYIEQLRQAPDLATMPVGRNVVVIGGGMTAIDVAVQVKLLGAENVTLAYRRGPEQMNASEFEQNLAQTAGVLIKHWVQPKLLLGDDAGHVSAVELEYTTVGPVGLKGTGEALTQPADMVFMAIGQAFNSAGFKTSAEAPATSKGRIQTDETGKTSLANVWAGGDCRVGGEDLTVAAVQDGKVAAEAIHTSLS